MAKQEAKIVERVAVREFLRAHEKSLCLEVVAGADGLDRNISEKSINRPALALTGYFKYFAHRRMQLFGAGEMAYLRDQNYATQREVLTAIAERNVPCIVISRGLAPTRALREVCNEQKIPLLRTNMKSKDFSADATLFLEDTFAPRTTLHGTLMDIKGIGVLLRGKSGVGKSECALALIERGHSLVADDIVYTRRVGENEVVGRSSELNRGYMECRGIGIINVAEMFGVRSVRLEKRIDLVITFIEWTTGMVEERTGLEHNHLEVLDIEVAHMELPVRPGRDMARLAEVAAMVNALRRIGHDPAKDFNDRLIAYMTGNRDLDEAG